MINITENLFAVGVKDPELRVFDIIMATEFGTTYNSYLLKNKSNEGKNEFVLFETVKNEFFDKFLAHLKENAIDINDIKYLVVDHTEPDHSGSISRLLELLPDITVISSVIAKKYLEAITNTTFRHIVAKDDSSLKLGSHTLTFKSVPQLHWPDTIYTYIEEDKALITCDSFGAHYSSDKNFYSELTEDEIADFNQAYKYYYDMIMGPFKPFVLKALDKIANLDIKIVAPGHGLIFNDKNFEYYKELYRKWSSEIISKDIDVLIGYVSAYGYTKKIANKIEQVLKEGNLKVVLVELGTIDIFEFMNQVQRSRALLIGSPTILADTLPPVWQVLSNLNSIINKGLIVGTFGSYGWSGEATKYICERFNQLKLKQPAPPLSINFNPSDVDMEHTVTFAKAILESL
ncbi:flavoprotein [Candidatus Epulonipiscioides gigas]|nr:flavoprotein [Epulopiscium sp. SCG-C07WGA-EpuloA2]